MKTCITQSGALMFSSTRSDELQDQPRPHDIGDTYAENVASFEFLEQTCHQAGFLTVWEAKYT